MIHSKKKREKNTDLSLNGKFTIQMNSRQKPQLLKLRQYILKYYERQTKLLSLIEQTHNFQSKHTTRTSRKSHKFTLVKRLSNLPPLKMELKKVSFFRRFNEVEKCMQLCLELYVKLLFLNHSIAFQVFQLAPERNFIKMLSVKYNILQ